MSLGFSRKVWTRDYKFGSWQHIDDFWSLGEWMRSSWERPRRERTSTQDCTLYVSNTYKEAGGGACSRTKMMAPRGRRNTSCLALAEPSAKLGRSQAVLIRCWDVVNSNSRAAHHLDFISQRLVHCVPSSFPFPEACKLENQQLLQLHLENNFKTSRMFGVWLTAGSLKSWWLSANVDSTFGEHLYGF